MKHRDLDPALQEPHCVCMLTPEEAAEIREAYFESNREYVRRQRIRATLQEDGLLHDPALG